MGYVAGETILDDEYIAFVNSSSSPFGINHIMGTGSGNQGLGQSTIGVVNAGDTITAAQWNALFTAMDNVANHTNTSLTSTAARAAGDPVAIVSSLVSDSNKIFFALLNSSSLIAPSLKRLFKVINLSVIVSANIGFEKNNIVIIIIKYFLNVIFFI